jgi:hypothetical protein
LNEVWEHLDPQDRALPPLPTISSIGISLRTSLNLATIAKRFIPIRREHDSLGISKSAAP